jgi:hypothetical protein
MERVADANLDQAPSRFICSDDPDEVVEGIAAYVELGFEELSCTRRDGEQDPLHPAGDRLADRARSPMASFQRPATACPSPSPGLGPQG